MIIGTWSADRRDWARNFTRRWGSFTFDFAKSEDAWGARSTERFYSKFRTAFFQTGYLVSSLGPSRARSLT